MGACACVDWVVLFRGRLFLSAVLLVWSLAPRDGVFWVGYVVLRWALYISLLVVERFQAPYDMRHFLIESLP